MKNIKIWQVVLLVAVFALAACDNEDIDNGGPDLEPGSGELLINEFMSSNDNVDVGGVGAFPDWIEIYNPGTEAVDIGGWHISDETSGFYRIPTGDPSTVVAGGGVILLFCADNGGPEDNVLNLPFNLSGSGDEINLADADQLLVDSIAFGAVITDKSMGRTPDGTGGFVLMDVPTPGASNGQAAGNQAPYFDSLGHSPLAPTPDDAVTVTAEIIDEDATVTVALFYTVDDGASWTEMAMTHDVKTTSVYTAEIPAQADGTTVGYYASATDSESLNTMEPVAGATGAITYEVISEVVVTLLINEFMASNDNWDVDGSMEYPDWIEIFNTTDEDINIGGWYMTDDPTLAFEDWFQFTAGSDTTIVPANGYLVVFADKNPEYGILHVDIKLSGSGESIGLADADQNIIDSLDYLDAVTGVTSGLSPDGIGDIVSLAVPTPGEANAKAQIADLGLLVINEFMASNETYDVDESGTFPDWIEIFNTGAIDINIGGWFMTDSIGPDFDAWVEIPTGSDSTVVPAGGHLVLFADSKPENGILHLDFKLGGSGETIGLANADQDILKYLVYGEQVTDFTFGLTPDGEGDHVALLTPTPGATNSAAAAGAGK